MKTTITIILTLVLSGHVNAHTRDKPCETGRPETCIEVNDIQSPVELAYKEANRTRYKWCCFHSSHSTLFADACANTHVYYNTSEGCKEKKRMHRSASGHGNSDCFRI